MKKILSLIFCILFVFLLCSCTSQASKSEDGKLKIVATIFPQFDFARTIAGDKAEVKMLITPGTETHSFEPTTSDIMDIQNCDIFIYTGGESDHWIENLLENTSKEDMTIISLMECVDIHEEEPHEHSHHNHSHVDEHVWTSPKNAMIIAENICSKMCTADPENAQYYTQNLNTYLAELGTLDREFTQITETARRNILVFADRFPLKHFADAYSLHYTAAFSGCSEDTEPSASVVAKLIDKVKEENIPVVFKIELSSDSIANTISKETGARVLTFYSCHNISKENFEKGETYLSLMKKNIESLSLALN